MKHKLFSASCLVAIAVIGTAPAYADPVGHGNTCGSSGQTSTPGNSASSPGSPFNEPGTNSMNGGKGGQAYTKAQRQQANIDERELTAQTFADDRWDWGAWGGFGPRFGWGRSW